MPKEGADFWRPNVCMNFLQEFMTAVKTAMEHKTDLEVAAFSWTPGDQAIVETECSDVTAEMLLPQWYRDKVFQ